MHGWLHSEVLKGRGHFGGLVVDGKIILQPLFTKLVMRSELVRDSSNKDPWCAVANIVTKLFIL